MTKIKKGFVIRLYPNAEQMHQIRMTAGNLLIFYPQRCLKSLFFGGFPVRVVVK